MALASNSSIASIALLLGMSLTAFAQDASPPAQTPPAPSPPAQSNSGQIRRPSRDLEPYIIEDGGLSLELFYWMTPNRPRLRGGSLVDNPDDYNIALPGGWKDTPGAVLSFPAGRQHTLRVSYFRTKGSGGFTTDKDLPIFGVGYTAGDFLTAQYKIQNGKVTWDFLSYTFPSTRIRFKTLWSAQYTTITTTLDAPFKDLTVDPATLVVNGNQGIARKQLFSPLFGIGFGQAVSKHFRWEVNTSGFGLPHKASTWDAEATAAIRAGHFELLVGEKVFSIKTTPHDDAYMRVKLAGAYGGVRFYWDNR
jgi:hypothetical protein